MSKDRGTRLPTRKTSSGSGPRRSTRSRIAETANSRQASTVEANTRQASTVEANSRQASTVEANTRRESTGEVNTHRLSNREANSRQAPEREANTRRSSVREANSRHNVEANTRPATRSRTRSRSRTRTSPSGEEITRSPTSGQLTTSPAFSPLSPTDPQQSGQEESSSESNSGSSEEAPIPSFLIPNVEIESPKYKGDSSETAASSSIDSPVYVPDGYSDIDPNQDDDEIPLDYDSSDVEWEIDRTGSDQPQEETIPQQQPEPGDKPPRHSIESDYDRLFNPDNGNGSAESDSDVEDAKLNSSVLGRRQYIARCLEESLRATLTSGCYQEQFWEKKAVGNRPAEYNKDSQDWPCLFVIREPRANCSHRFRWHEEDHASECLTECMRALLRQMNYYRLNGTPQDRAWTSNAPADFGELVFKNLGKNKIWKTMWKNLHDCRILMPPGLQASCESSRYDILEAIAYRDSNPEGCSNSSVHCFGGPLITTREPTVTRPNPIVWPPPEGKYWQRGTVWEDPPSRHRSSRSSRGSQRSLWNPDRDHFTGTPNGVRNRPHSRHDEPYERQRPTRSPSPDRQPRYDARQRADPPHGRDSTSWESTRSSYPAQGTVREALKVPSYTKWISHKDKEWADVIAFLQKARTRNESRQIQNWSTRTRSSISSLWKDHAPAEERARNGFKKDSWTTLSPSMLIDWMERMRTEEVVGYNRSDRYRQLLQLISENPLVVNCNDDRITSKDNPVRDATLILEEAIEAFNTESIPPLTRAEEKELCKLAWDRFKLKGLTASAAEQNKSAVKRICSPSDTPDDPKRFIEMLDAIQSKVAEILLQRQTFQQTFVGKASASSGTGSDPKPKTAKDSSTKNRPNNKRKGQSPSRADHSSTKKPTAKCYGCGYQMSKEKGSNKWICTRKVPGSSEIGCYKDPRRNAEKGVDFLESSVGKQWADLGFKSIPKDPTITLSNASSRHDNRSGTHLNALHTDSLDANLIPFAIPQGTPKPNARRKRKGSDLCAPGRLLLDTGAIGCSVMSKKYAKRLRKCHGSYSSSAANHAIATAGKSNLKSDKLINLTLEIASGSLASDTPTQVDVTAAVAPIEVDMILDRDTIKDNNLVQKFPEHFAKGELLEKLRALPLVAPPATTAPHAVLSGRAQNGSFVLAYHVNPTWDNWVEATKPRIAQTPRSLHRKALIAEALKEEGFRDDPVATPWALNSLSAEPMDTRLSDKQKRARARRKKRRGAAPLFTETQLEELHGLFLAAMCRLGNGDSNFSAKSAYEREGKLALDEIPEHKLESIPADLLREVLEDNEYTNVHVGGPPELRDKLRKLIREFKEVFRATVQRRPSSAFTPFVLDVDDEAWEQPCNAGPPRTMGREREEELDRMIQVLMTNDIIEDCTHTYCSAAFLTPKPNGKWRFVLDFKGLNKATRQRYDWPIPNIKDMLIRVGDSRPEFFATFDLTSGYYQAPIAEESRKYTAFKTKKGVYRWKRLAMGLREAGSYFQHQLSTKVLNGLIHNTCELYLDDCMVYARDVDEYIERLRAVFNRFREHGITLNPAKCQLGLTQVEYVGHTISKNGLHFTRDKIDSVVNFPLPSTMKNVKSFVGLANYFRDHIRDHSTRVQPLQDLVEGYTKQKARQRVTWTDACQKAFEDIRQAIDECPLLWFVDDFSPIFLQTDASDYGIGAYLYQKVLQEDGTEVEHPVGFISKSLVSGHDSWDVPMKEGFAIFYALRKWEYLLRDRKFTILTDHANLTRMREERNTNKMVKRWFQAYQEYDIIDWIHVPGIDNQVPDSFSRLCANECSGDEDKTSTSLLFQLTGYEMNPEHWEIIRTKGHGTASDRGHGGVTRTIEVLERQGLRWPTRAKDVRKFIKMCPCCQKMNVMKPVIHSHPFTLSTYGLFHTVSVDLIERLATDDYGMSMIVVIIDNFSRFVDLYPISNTSAEATADALIQFTGRFRTPVRFTTDSGSNFKSKIIEGLMKRLGADHHLTKAYSKQQNGMVERVNREVLEHLRGLIFDKRVQTKWSRYLPIVQRYINTSVHSATGCTPAELVFPSGAEIDKQFLVDPSGGSLSDYVREMQEAQHRVIALAEQRLRRRDQAHMARNSDNEEPEFAEGSYVLAEHRHNSLRPGPKSKMLPFKAGPMLVIRKLPNGMYTLRDLITMEPKDFHVSKLTPFLYDERTLEPAHVAAKDTFDEFVIEKVIDMVGDPTQSRKNLQFLVRWAGYGPEDDTLVDWKDCRTATAVQTYLYNHPNKRVRNLCMKDFNPNQVVEEAPFDRHSDDESTTDC